MSGETLGILYFIKTYLLASIFAFFGGIAHAIQNVKKAGWRGWVSFGSDVVVCIFFGNVFYQIGLLTEPNYAIIMTSVGSFWGAKSFEYLKEWILNSLKAKLK